MIQTAISRAALYINSRSRNSCYHAEMTGAVPDSQNAYRLILAGGGDAEDSRLADARFARWTGAGRMIYVPLALEPRAYESGFDWLKSVFQPLGVQQFSMLRDAADVAALDPADIGGIYIGGGNTYVLLDLARRFKLDALIRQAAARGVTVYGGSAGALLMTPAVSNCAYFDPNEIGLQDLRALALTPFDVWVHYEHADHHRHLAAAARQADRITIGIPERAALCMQDGAVTVLGTSPCWRMQPDGATQPINPESAS
jgi:dipeptidase E